MRALLGLLVFLAPVAAVSWTVERAARPLWPEAAGPSLQERIDRSFSLATSRHYDVLVVGNSRIYRGINPDELGVAAYNFAQDDDAFNQVFHKLRFLEARGVRFSTIVMGVDYFEFSFLSDRRNAFYGPLLGDAYLRDFAARPGGGWWSTLLHPIDEQAFNNFMISYFTRPASLLVSSLTSRGEAARPIRYVLKDNGQFILDAGPQRADPIRRDATRLPIQEQYFIRILEWARDRGIRMVLVMPPLRQLELNGYDSGVIEPFDAWLTQTASRFGAVYLDLSRHPEFSDADFSDITHLTEAAADRFSRLVGAELARR
jgi:hypothetical protein